MRTLSFAKTFLVGLALVLLLPSTWAATRGPYLQNGTETTITLRWRTSQSYVGMVRYGTNVNSLNTDVIASGSSTNHSITVTGLTPGTKYYYRIGNSSGAVLETPVNQQKQYFTTNPAGPIATRIWVLGDPGTGTSNQRDVRDAYYNLTANEGRETNVVLALGDNAYNDGTDSEYGNNFFDVYQDMFQKTPVWSTQGNHERSTPTYQAVFSHPTNGEGGGIPSGSELYYSFNFGDFHFVCLDSYGSAIDNSSNAPQFQWLQQDLAANTKKWVIAFWHHPPYSYTSNHNADNETDMVRMRQNAVEMLEDAGVDLVLGGHNHHYDRTQFINGHYGNSSSFNPNTHVVQAGDGNGTPYAKSDNRGATYVMTGSAGKNNTYSIINKPVTQIAFDRLGSFIIESNAANTELTMRMLRNNGGVDDMFKISKAPAVNGEPTVDAGAGGTIEQQQTFNLNGVVTDDGFPGNPLSVSWSQVGGPTGGAQFANATSAMTSVTFSTPGTYDLRLSANDGEFNVFDNVIVAVEEPGVNNPPTVVSVGDDQDLDLPVATVSVSATVSDDSFPGNPLVTTWSGTGGVTFANPGSLSTTASLPSGTGVYTLTLTANDGQYTDSDSLTVTVSNQAPYAVNDTASVPVNGAVLIDVLDNDSDPNDQEITLLSVTQPLNGSTVIDSGSVLYTPDSGFVGVDSFTYQVGDTLGAVASASVTIEVGASDVEFDSVSISTGDLSTFTFNHTVSGEDPLLLVTVSCDSGETAASVSYGGVDLTEVVTMAHPQDKPAVGSYQMAGPPLGTAQVRATLSGGNSDKCAVSAMSFNGVNQDDPVTQIVTASGESSIASVTVPANEHDMVVEFMANIASGSSAPLSGQTEYAVLEMGGSGNSDHFAVAAVQLAQADGDVELQHQLSESKEWVIIGLSINAGSTLSVDDVDGDGLSDSNDNCTLVSNPDQLDTNGDGYGNICDADLNNDGAVNFLDVAEFSAAFLQAGVLDADFNGDGVVNFLDIPLIQAQFLGVPGPSGLVP